MKKFRDIDPESLDFQEHFSSSDEEGADKLMGFNDSGESEDDEARSHYVQMEKSKLRKVPTLDAMDPKYVGQTAKRAEIFSESEESIADEEYPSMGLIMENEEESTEGEDLEEMDDSAAVIANEMAQIAKQDAAIVKKLVKTAQVDVDKGQKVKNQIGIFEVLLGSRIKVQNCLNIMNSVGTSTKIEDEQVFETLAGLVDTLLDLKCSLLSTATDSEISANSPAESRKNHSGKDFIRKAIEDNETIDNQPETKNWMDETVEKWNRKVQITSGTKTAFKALNQSIPQQINKIWESDKNRLIKRTQVNRSPSASSSSSTAADGSKLDENIFDDNDFYQTLLRDFIDSKTTGMDPLEVSRQWAQLKSMHTKKHRDNLDRKASKGRKIRYAVHEKLQNFMVPIYNMENSHDSSVSVWHEEMTRELFRTIPTVYSSNN